MIVGFTGTRHGMTDGQCECVVDMLEMLKCTEFHHGDCVGADSQAAHLVRLMDNIKIVCHPPIKAVYRAHVPLRPQDIKLEAKEYIERNHDIVDACEHLLIAPNSNIEQLRSGTWATYRYAVACGRPTTMITR